MFKFATSYPYNVFTLSPRTKEDKNNFWTFRCQDISNMVYV